jgi:hypothetical protein
LVIATVTLAHVVIAPAYPAISSVYRFLSRPHPPYAGGDVIQASIILKPQSKRMSMPITSDKKYGCSILL